MVYGRILPQYDLRPMRWYHNTTIRHTAHEMIQQYTTYGPWDDTTIRHMAHEMIPQYDVWPLVNEADTLRKAYRITQACRGMTKGCVKAPTPQIKSRSCCIHVQHAWLWTACVCKPDVNQISLSSLNQKRSSSPRIVNDTKRTFHFFSFLLTNPRVLT